LLVDKATEFFRKALELQPNNVYAANGIGVVCVAKGRLHEAMQIFTQVREASSSCEHATLNLAQLNAALLEHATAASLYEAATKRVAPGAKLQQLRLLRARNLFEDREYLESRKVLQSLVCDAPELQVAWHNLGLAYLYAARHPAAQAYEQGIDVPPPRSVEVVRAAQVALEHARAQLDGRARVGDERARLEVLLGDGGVVERRRQLGDGVKGERNGRGRRRESGSRGRRSWLLVR
jgi:tetratricopeptide (TPR) repeat protein